MGQSSDEVIIEAYPSGRYGANDIAITGDTNSKEVDYTLRYLQLKENRLFKLKDKKVLSVGEGFSSFLPTLLKTGLDATALDLWYHRTDIPDNGDGVFLNRFNKEFGEHLVQGSACDMPFADASFDAVFSARLINNLFAKDVKNKTDFMAQFLIETIRVLKPGGHARHAALHRQNGIRKARAVLDSYGNNISYSIRKSEWLFTKSETAQESWDCTYLIVIRKK